MDGLPGDAALAGLWPDSDDDSDDAEGGFVNSEQDSVVLLGGTEVRVRERAFDALNANRCWPGNTLAATWLAEHWASVPELLSGPVLELGAATGALAAWLTMRGANVTTSDAADEGAIACCVAETFALNGLAPRTAAQHVAHTWGEPVPDALLGFPLIVAVEARTESHALLFPSVVSVTRARRGPLPPVPPFRIASPRRDSSVGAPVARGRPRLAVVTLRRGAAVHSDVPAADRDAVRAAHAARRRAAAAADGVGPAAQGRRRPAVFRRAARRRARLRAPRAADVPYRGDGGGGRGGHHPNDGPGSGAFGER